MKDVWKSFPETWKNPRRSPADISLLTAVSGHPADQAHPGGAHASNWAKCAAPGNLCIFHTGSVPTPPMEHCPCALWGTVTGERALIISATRLAKAIQIKFPHGLLKKWHQRKKIQQHKNAYSKQGWFTCKQYFSNAILYIWNNFVEDNHCFDGIVLLGLREKCSLPLLAASNMWIISPK